MSQPNIHTPDDGRGHRKVFVDGREVRRCFYADTQRGIADCFREPLRLDRWKKRALSYRLRGVVTVEAMDGPRS